MSRELLQAYYFALEKTGCEPVDAILAAVASQGNGAHHTEDWEVDEIQSAADQAATKIDRMERENALFRSALKHNGRIQFTDRFSISNAQPEFYVYDNHREHWFAKGEPMRPFATMGEAFDALLGILEEEG